VSVGAVLAASTTDTDDALSRSDHALYRAKRAGRNQVALESVNDDGQDPDAEIRDLLDDEGDPETDLPGTSAAPDRTGHRADGTWGAGDG